MKRLLPAAGIALMLHALLLGITMQGNKELPKLPPVPSSLTMNLQYRHVARKQAAPAAPLPEVVKKATKPSAPEEKKKKAQKTIAVKEPEPRQSIKPDPVITRKRVQPIEPLPLAPKPEEQQEQEKTKTDSSAKPEEKLKNIETDVGKENTVPQENPQVLVKAQPIYHVNPPPRYPRLARRRGWQGTVLLNVFVDEQGMPDEITIAAGSGHSVLDKAAKSAVSRWRFVPGTENNISVPMWVQVPVRFDLKNN